MNVEEFEVSEKGGKMLQGFWRQGKDDEITWLSVSRVPRGGKPVSRALDWFFEVPEFLSLPILHFRDR